MTTAVVPGNYCPWNPVRFCRSSLLLPYCLRLLDVCPPCGEETETKSRGEVLAAFLRRHHTSTRIFKIFFIRRHVHEVIAQVSNNTQNTPTRRCSRFLSHTTRAYMQSGHQTCPNVGVNCITRKFATDTPSRSQPSGNNCR